MLFVSVLAFPQQKSFAESNIQHFTSEHDLLVLSDLSYINFDESDKDHELGNILSGNENVKEQLKARISENLTSNGIMQEREINTANNWELITFYDDNNKTGFYGVAFQHKYTKEVVIAFRGSENGIENTFKEGGQDWRYDIFSVVLQLQLDSYNQFIPARKFVKEVINKVNKESPTKNPTILLTGHSLGGFLAQRLAIDLDRGLLDGIQSYHLANTVTFNAPGFLPTNPITNSPADQAMHDLGIKPGAYITAIEYIDRKNYNVKNYVVSGDLVGSLGNITGNADFIDGHVGETVYLDYYDLFSNGAAIPAVSLEYLVYKYFAKIDIGSSKQRHALTNFYKSPFDIHKDFKGIELLDEYGEVINNAEASIYLYDQLISTADEVNPGVYRFDFFKSNNLPLTIEAKAKGFKNGTFNYDPTKDIQELQLEANWGSKEDVNPHHDWTIKFNDYLDETTINNSNIFVQYNKEDVEGIKVSLSKDKKSVTVEAPIEGYLLGETYSLNIRPSVHSVNGDPLENTIEMEFTITLKDLIRNIGQEVEAILKGGWYFTDNGVEPRDFSTLEEKLKKLVTKRYMEYELKDIYYGMPCIECDFLYFPWKVEPDLYFEIIESQYNHIVIQTVQSPNYFQPQRLVTYTFKKVDGQWLLDDYESDVFDGNSLDIPSDFIDSGYNQGNIAKGETITSNDLINNIGDTLHFNYTPDQLKTEFGEPNLVKTTMSNMMLYYNDAVYTFSGITNQVDIVSVQEGKASSFYENINDVKSIYSKDGSWKLEEEVHDDGNHLIVYNSDYYLVFISNHSTSKIESFWVQRIRSE